MVCREYGVHQVAPYLTVHYDKSGVRCNTILPGPFPNPNLQRDQPEFVERLSQKVPLGRVGQAPVIAGAVAFLLNDASSYIQRKKPSLWMAAGLLDNL